jgi:hypothetical protein
MMLTLLISNSTLPALRWKLVVIVTSIITNSQLNIFFLELLYGSSCKNLTSLPAILS